ncbi:cbb3-type cytochrome c oxidase subunit I [Elongatibacter sediminis]|uniref:Cbb3-type cytochrome c oxidase subunit I n=1 Tax=Elongatibacter sediminis TaxID=3119006 RepID=A0AAW9RM51_9GAMM
MSPARYDLPIHSESLRRTASAWLMLGLAALVGAGLFSLMLVLARTPAIQDLLPVADFFRVALVIHVNLSVLIWLLSIAGVFWALACRDDRPVWDRFSFWMAAAGTATVALSPLAGAAEPLMNNYIPILRHPVFHTGMALFAAGIFIHLARTSLPWRDCPAEPRGRLTGADALRTGSRLAAAITGIAIFALLASLTSLPAGMGGLAYYEFLFWGSGHVLQFTHTLLMMLSWVLLASASGCRFPLSPRVTISFLLILAMPVITVPFLYLAHDVMSPGHRLAFTELMKFGGLSCLPLGLAVVVSLWGAAPAQGEARFLRAALVTSIVLFATGGVLGFMISGLDIVIPAHYHGSTVGVTIAFMGLTYYLLPRLGFGAVPQRMAFWQPIVYGSGQLMHIAGLAWTGGYGVQRKTAGAEQGLDRIGEIAGMGLMGLGGLVSVIGGLLFLIVAWRALRNRHAVPASQTQAEDETECRN